MVCGLSKIYEDNGREVVALKDVNLEVKESEFVMIVGPSGCGKTSLITKGSVQFLATAQDPNIKMYANGASSDFVLTMDASEGADGLVATGDIKSLDELTDFFELVK